MEVREQAPHTFGGLAVFRNPPVRLVERGMARRLVQDEATDASQHCPSDTLVDLEQAKPDSRAEGERDEVIGSPGVLIGE
jgi:hypothetical protein